MLKSHKNLLEPRPSDRLRIGERIVDLPLREIAPLDGSGDPVRVTLKSIGVLMALVAHAGKPISREALLEWVWPDTLPTDDVLTQAIAQLRKAFGDEREHPRYIETIAKQGYRLIAAIEWIVEGDGIVAAEAAIATDTHPQAGIASVRVMETASEPEPLLAEAVATTARTTATLPSPPSPSRPRSLWRRPAVALGALGTLAACAALALGLDGWRRTPDTAAMQTVALADRGAPAPRVLRLTSMPGGEYRPSLSPDGSLLVYVQEGDDKTSSLMVQNTAPVPPRAMTEPVPGRLDMAPAWSPDGREIAFIRQVGERCAVMLISAAGGNAREAGECLGGSYHLLGWYPDGRALVGSQVIGKPAGSGRLADLPKAVYRMPLASGRWEPIPYDRAPADEDLRPVVSPDGRWIAFQRNVSLADLWMMPVAGGMPRRLTQLRTNFYGLSWAPDGRALVFSRYLNGRVILGSLDIASGAVREFHGGDLDSLMYPSIPARGDTIAFEIEDSRTRMRRVALDEAGFDETSLAKTSLAETSLPQTSRDETPPETVGRSAAGAASPAAKGEPKPLLARGELLLEATGSNLLPSIAPDGNQLTFYSDRSGDLLLWWVDQSQPETLRVIAGFVPVARYPVLWDARSEHLLAIGEGVDGKGVYDIEPRSGRMRKLPVPDAEPIHVAHHADAGKLLVVADRGEGRLRLTLYDRGASPWRVLARVDDVAMSLLDAPNRRILMARTATNEIWAADLQLRGATAVDRTAAQRHNRMLKPTPDGAWVLDSREGCEFDWRPVAGGIADDKPGASGARCLSTKLGWALSGFSYDPHRKIFYFSMIEEMHSDIGLLPLSALTGDSAPRVAGFN
jgi:DNA-binding winged helix-turn-helix (wHTH) protein/Tol biopolymer transport system component